MRALLIFASAGLIAGASATAQTGVVEHIPTRSPPTKTVATLGTCTDGSPRLAYVTDGASSNDCSVGGAVPGTEVLCRCSDGAWSAGSGGTVTSVAVAVPSEWSVSGSPITGSGTITISEATQTANTVYAGPTSGGVAAPGFRSLVSSDIPDLSGTYALTGSGVTDHGALTGLGDDDHTQYTLGLGRTGGQTIIGGLGGGDDLLLQSSSHSTRGEIAIECATYTPGAYCPSITVDMTGTLPGAQLHAAGTSGWTDWHARGFVGYSSGTGAKFVLRAVGNTGLELSSDSQLMWADSTDSTAWATDTWLGRAERASLYLRSTNFAAAGDAQTTERILRNSTTDATPTELFLRVNTSTRMTLADDSSWSWSCQVVARRTDADGESAGYLLQGVIDRQTNAASTALVGTITTTVLAEDTGAWDVTAEADTTNGALVLKVTGENAKTIRWVAFCRTSEVTG